MNILKAIAISFSLYSKIPMPQFKWGDKAMSCSLIFFPWIGAVILGFELLLMLATRHLDIPLFCATLLFVAIPLVITGGFHVDGFMDVEDALKSYAAKEKKLAILKDPHIGAFSVIRLITVGLIYIAAVGIIFSGADIKIYGVTCLGFVVSRCLSGIGVSCLKPAKSDGMLNMEAKGTGNVVKVFLAIQLVFSYAMALYLSVVGGIILIISSIASFIFYKNKSYKEFGGVTGDTAGYFVVICECALAAMIAVYMLISCATSVRFIA